MENLFINNLAAIVAFGVVVFMSSWIVQLVRENHKLKNKKFRRKLLKDIMKKMKMQKKK